MSVTVKTSDGVILAEIAGELDHHTAKYIRSEIDREISSKSPRRLIIDFSGVTFMDSSGIGLVMGRYKLMQDLDGDVVISRPPDYIRKVMKLAGIDRLVTFTERPDRLFPRAEDNKEKEAEKADSSVEKKECEKIEAKAN